MIETIFVIIVIFLLMIYIGVYLLEIDIILLMVPVVGMCVSFLLYSFIFYYPLIFSPCQWRI